MPSSIETLVIAFLTPYLPGKDTAVNIMIAGAVASFIYTLSTFITNSMLWQNIVTRTMRRRRRFEMQVDYTAANRLASAIYDRLEMSVLGNAKQRSSSAKLTLKNNEIRACNWHGILNMIKQGEYRLQHDQHSIYVSCIPPDLRVPRFKMTDKKTLKRDILALNGDVNENKQTKSRANSRYG